MNFVSLIIIAFLPGGWIIFGVYKLYTLFIQKRSYDTKEIEYALSDIIMLHKGKRHKPYVGSFISLTDDISYVINDDSGNNQRRFKC